VLLLLDSDEVGLQLLPGEEQLQPESESDDEEEEYRAERIECRSSELPSLCGSLFEELQHTAAPSLHGWSGGMYYVSPTIPTTELTQIFMEMGCIIMFSSELCVTAVKPLPRTSVNRAYMYVFAIMRTEGLLLMDVGLSPLPPEPDWTSTTTTMETAHAWVRELFKMPPEAEVTPGIMSEAKLYMHDENGYFALSVFI